MLDKVAVYKEKTESLKKKIKKGADVPGHYPGHRLYCYHYSCLVKVVPTFQEMFNNFGAELPAPTQFVVYLSVLAQTYWLHAFGILAVIGVGFTQGLKRSPAFRDAFEKIHPAGAGVW